MLECSLITSYYDFVIISRFMWLIAITQNQSKEIFFFRKIIKITWAKGCPCIFSDPKSVLQEVTLCEELVFYNSAGAKHYM